MRNYFLGSASRIICIFADAIKRLNVSTHLLNQVKLNGVLLQINSDWKNTNKQMNQNEPVT